VAVRATDVSLPVAPVSQMSSRGCLSTAARRWSPQMPSACYSTSCERATAARYENRSHNAPYCIRIALTPDKPTIPNTPPPSRTKKCSSTLSTSSKA
jgi:hypothetical protein